MMDVKLREWLFVSLGSPLPLQEDSDDEGAAPAPAAAAAAPKDKARKGPGEEAKKCKVRAASSLCLPSDLVMCC